VPKKKQQRSLRQGTSTKNKKLPHITIPILKLLQQTKPKSQKITKNNQFLSTQIQSPQKPVILLKHNLSNRRYLALNLTARSNFSH